MFTKFFETFVLEVLYIGFSQILYLARPSNGFQPMCTIKIRRCAENMEQSGSAGVTVEGDAAVGVGFGFCIVPRKLSEFGFT